MKTLIVVIALLTATQASADWFDAAGYGVYAARAGDVISTEFALQRVGVSEFNPIFQNKGVRIASFAGAPVIILLTSKLHKKKPKLALVIRIVAIVAWGSATTNNMRIGR